jgi:hypothetical protein
MSKGTMIPPSYILLKPVLGPLCCGQKPPFKSGWVKLLSCPRKNLQTRYPRITHASGAIHEIALLLLLGCAAVELLAAPAVGLVSAMIQLFLFFKNLNG